MSKKKIERKTRVKPFVKYVNYNHMLATRFMIKEDFDFKDQVNDEKMEDAESRKAARKEIKKILEEK